MNLSNKQKHALEKITGKYWNYWNPEAAHAFFLFTDKGKRESVSQEAVEHFTTLVEAQHGHSITVELWKRDFKQGLLFLDDFLNNEYPETYIQHAFIVYREIMGSIPSKYLKTKIGQELGGGNR